MDERTYRNDEETVIIASNISRYRRKEASLKYFLIDQRNKCSVDVYRPLIVNISISKIKGAFGLIV